MKTKIIFILLCFLSLNVMGQGIVRRNKPQTTQTQPTKTHRQEAQGKLKTKTASKPKVEKTCDTCGKVLSKCEYNGNHPEPEAAGYDVTFTCNVPSAKLYVDGKDSGNAGDTHFLKTGNHSIKVSAEGYKDYQKSISVNRQNTSCSIALEKKPEPAKPKSGTLNGHEWVDLGLSVKWATCNVGASSPSDYGGYYAWGETSTKNDYSWSTLKYCNDKKGKSFAKYNQDARGTKDNRTVLELNDDAAHANWGGSWRMPTIFEFMELREKCTWTWTTQDGHNGYMVTSKNNGNSIFLPASGYRHGSSLDYATSDSGCYWSSSLGAGYGKQSEYAFVHRFDSSGVAYLSNSSLVSSYRCYGRSVRPVCP